jgi:hypothetical protein
LLKGHAHATLFNFNVGVCCSSRGWGLAANPLPGYWPQTSTATRLVERLSDCRGRVYYRANDGDVRGLTGGFMNPKNLEQGSVAQQNTNPKTIKEKRLIGLAIVIVCVGITIFDWRQTVSPSKFDIFIGLLSPFFTCLGLSILLYPGAKKYISDNTPESLLLGQKALLGAGLVSGILNWLFINGIL